MNQAIELIQQPFILRSLFVTGVLSILLASIGVFLTLKHKSFMVDGIAHASLLGIAIGLIAGNLTLPGSIIVATTMAIAITYFHDTHQNTIDSLIGIFYSILFALAIFIINLNSHYTADLSSYLFGSILLITTQDVIISLILSGIFFTTLILFYDQFLYATFDKESAYIRGVPVKLIEYFINIFSALLIVISIKIVGIILLSGLVLIPATTAKLFAKNFKQMFYISSILAITGVLIATFITLIYNTPPGSSIVLTLGVFFLIANIKNAKK